MLWIEWANSLHYAWRSDGAATDELDTPGWPLAWARRHGLPVGAAPSHAELRELKRLRGLLRDIAAACKLGNPLAADALEALNGFMAAGGGYSRQLRRDETGYALHEAPAGASCSA